jgi:HAD superfamily hydrolase (TIGR01509 family)
VEVFHVGRPVTSRGKQLSQVVALAGGLEEAFAAKKLERNWSTNELVFPVVEENRADDKWLQNPLLRLERFGVGWFGVVLDWEGVIVDEDPKVERRVWEAVAEEEGRPLPPAWLLRRAEGMKTEQVVAEVLCWTRDPMQVRRIARRQEHLFQEAMGGNFTLMPGVKAFLDTVKKYGAPMAIGTTRPREYVEQGLQQLGLQEYFDAIIAADDVARGKPDPEMYSYAAQAIGRIPSRCVVVGSVNACTEAAHDAGMKAISVASRHMVWELSAADSVVRSLIDLDIRGLKLIISQEQPQLQLEMEMEEEEEHEEPESKIGFSDDW